MGIIIYLIGYVLAYIVFKKVIFNNNKYTLGEALLGLFFAILSWVGVFTIALTYLIFNLNQKPPRWL